MESIKEFILKLPLDWILHGTDVSIVQMLLVSAGVAAVCVVLALLSGVFDRELHRRFDNSSGIAYPAFMMQFSYSVLRKVSRGKKGWYCLSATREYSLARISVTLVTIPYYLTYKVAHFGSSFLINETVEHLESSVTPYWIALSIVFLALAVIFSLVHRSFFMTLATWLGGGWCSLVLMCLCAKLGGLVADWFLVGFAWEIFEYAALFLTPLLSILSCLFKLVSSRNGEGDFEIRIPVENTGESSGAAVPSIEDDSDEDSGDEFDLHRLPTIIYDDQNRAWYKQYMAGDSAVYQEKESGERVTIYSGEISGSGANTSAGYFHWY